jgi:hypothetical protein
LLSLLGKINPIHLLSHTFESLENRNFRLLWFGMVFSMWGIQMQMVARGILVYDLTGDYTITGFVGMGFAPSLLVVSLFGGVLGDRMERRSIIQIAQLVNGLLAGLVGILVLVDVVVWQHLFAVSSWHHESKHRSLHHRNGKQMLPHNDVDQNQNAY